MDRNKGRRALSLKDGELQHFTHNPADPYSLPNDRIYDIVSDRQNRIWIATCGGLAIAERVNGTYRFISNRNKLNWFKNGLCQRLRRITCTNKGIILVATTDGLVTFSDEFKDYSKIKFYHSNHIIGDTASLMASDVNYTLVRSNGDTYISTLSGCLQITTSKSLLENNIRVEFVKNINQDEGIVQSMIEDNAGNIWIIRESSVDKFNPSTGKTDVLAQTILIST